MTIVFGPFCRLESLTQTREDALIQQRTMQVWGRPARGSNLPSVKAYRRQLEPGERGVEFGTEIVPMKNGSPFEARWYYSAHPWGEMRGSRTACLRSPADHQLLEQATVTMKISEPEFRQIDAIGEDLAPQAIFSLPVEAVVGQCGKVIDGSDDFDFYKGANFQFDDHAFALRHYRGHPPETTTLYLPDRLRDVGVITAAVAKVMTAFQVGSDRLFWQRCEDPNY